MVKRFDQVAKACPELTAAECEAVCDHLHDTTTVGQTWYPELIQAAARSLFPYQAKPKDSVVFLRKEDNYRIAIRHLDAAVKSLNNTRPNDNVAQIILDIQCCIHYINEETDG